MMRHERRVYLHVHALSGRDQPPQTPRPVGLAADQGQHRWRPGRHEETALGNIQKIGKKCAVDGVLEQAEMPTDPGLWLMDSSSAAAEMVTLCAASGCAIHCFPTGQGNGIGNAIVPVIKICANPRTVRLMSEHVGGATLGLLQRRITRDRAGAASTCGMTRSRSTTHCAVVGKLGIGLDNIDVEACKRRAASGLPQPPARTRSAWPNA